MGLFSEQSTEGHDEGEDRIGGGGGAKPTDIYSAKVKMAYVTNSATSKSRAVNLILEVNGSEVRETIWVLDGEGKNWFPNKQDATKRVTLPGYTTVNDLCLVASGKDLASQATEEKVVKIYDFDARKELPKSVPVLVDIIGGEILVALQEVWENKREKRGDEYVDIAGERKFNQIAKVMDPGTQLTVLEATKGGASAEAQWHTAWLERNKGKPYDKRSIKDGAAAAGAPKSSAGAPAAGQQQPRTSLFGK